MLATGASLSDIVSRGRGSSVWRATWTLSLSLFVCRCRFGTVAWLSNVTTSRHVPPCTYSKRTRSRFPCKGGTIDSITILLIITTHCPSLCRLICDLLNKRPLPVQPDHSHLEPEVCLALAKVEQECFRLLVRNYCTAVTSSCPDASESYRRRVQALKAQSKHTKSLQTFEIPIFTALLCSAAKRCTCSIFLL